MEDEEELGRLLAEFGIRHQDRPEDDALLGRLDEDNGEEYVHPPARYDDYDE